MTVTKRKTVADMLRSLSPCEDAMTWAAGYTSAAKAWKECERGDWMFWLLGKQSGPPESDGRKKLVLAACDCAALALPHTKDQRVKVCIDVARKWARGEATIQELREARKAAAAAAYAADDAAAYAYAYAYAAADADAYAYAAAYAADAYAADAADADDAARKRVLAECAAIVRRHYPKPPKVSE